MSKNRRRVSRRARRSAERCTILFAFGEYDVILLYEAPDNASAAARLLTAVGAGSGAASKTTVLMSMDEAITAMRKAGAASGQYQPPGS